MTDTHLTSEEYRRIVGSAGDAIAPHLEATKDTAAPKRRIKNRPEEDLQIACVEYLRLLAERLKDGKTRCAAFHPGNERGNLTRYEMVVRWRLGVMAGVADLILMLPGGRGAALELKAGANQLSQKQRDFKAICAELGWPHRVVRSPEQFENALVWLGVISDQERVLDRRKT